MPTISHMVALVERGRGVSSQEPGVEGALPVRLLLCLSQRVPFQRGMAD